MFRFISYIFMALALSSCMAATEDIAPPDARFFIGGRVSDSEDRPIEHIRITLEWKGSTIPPAVTYTASDGIFVAEIPDEAQAETVPVRLTIEDIDGEDYGGLFNTVTDNIIHSTSPESPSDFLVYRLNRATASENIPQS